LKLFFTGILLLMFRSGDGQHLNDAKRGVRAQSIYIEIGGNGVLFSANYDFRFAKKQDGFGARAGIGFFPDVGIATTAVIVPLGVNYLLGKGSSYFEAGLGVTVIASSAGEDFFGNNGTGETFIVFVPSIGYRYQPIRNGFTARIFASPLIGDGDFQFWAGFSLGYKLK
jgi:hypothetical protein